MPRPEDPKADIARLLEVVRERAAAGDLTGAGKAKHELYSQTRRVSKARLVAATRRSHGAANAALRLEDWALRMLRDANDLIATARQRVTGPRD